MEHKLKKDLGLLDVFSIASGAMISSGLFILPALAYSKAGPAVIFAYILAGILVLPAMLSQAELTTAMPKAGGAYFYIERSMGAPAGTVGGFANWFSLSFKSAFALVGMGIFATLINPSITEIQIKLIAIGCCLFFMTLNIIGVKETAKFQAFLVLSLIGILLFYIARGFLYIEPYRFKPFTPYGWGKVFATAGMVFVSFGGLTKISSVAEEVKRPGRTIPLGMLLAFFVTIFLYGAVVFVTVGLLDSIELSKALTPISIGANVFMGKGGIILLAIAGLLAFISTANAGILTASRAALAMGRDYLLPSFLDRIGRRKTPYIAILFTGLFMIGIILFLSLENLVKTASTLMILLFIFVNLSLIVMRESKIQSYRPEFHAPLYPWLQILGIVGCGFLIFEMGRIPLSITAAFIAGALVWYLAFARKRVKRQAAIVHIVERVTAKEMVDATLPDELKEIIIDRDKIVEDRFDHLIKQCEILDYTPKEASKYNAESLFEEASNILAKRLGIDKKALHNLFIQREKESSTVVTPGLAIPHIIIEGTKKFDIMVVRCKKGVTFPDNPTSVHTMFVLVGTRDERNFHLKALSAIAQIAQDKKFDKEWLAAVNTDQLRTILLLAERKRIKH